MKYSWIGMIVILGLLTACTMAPMMSPSAFNTVPVGGGIESVKSIYGDAFEVVELSDGVQEHHYVQRMELPSGAVEQTTYVFTTHQGRIVGKEKREERNSCHRYLE